ncbi:cytochrome o ubiquinol oxidase subunit IV [Fodinicurvata fenggangensis]|uniref:cytochrome o ubiquinol oxidase subunit IV n=1 Tax=Fodinicurvata fenggangensis TaxID=1121830 RepID=UPI000479B16A|nr:cytochrome o ubiquinol oxidase subunit IV [Fodinicurvata fenggangensis]
MTDSSSNSPARPALPGLKRYLTGFVLALILTVIPFALVATGSLPRTETLLVVVAAAVVQILVHLRFFLHLGVSTTPRETLLAIAFASVLIFIMIGGSIWIMFDLHQRMFA